MKTIKQIISTMALLAGCVAANAAIEYQGAVTVNQLIPDGSASGLASTINVSLPGGQIVAGSLSVTLNVSGTYNGDLYAYLTHGSGFAVLLNRVGSSATDGLGYGDSGLNVQFSDSAANGNIHTYQQVTTPAAGSQLGGTWAPDGRNVSPYTVNGTETPTATLSSFDGTDPNGAWTLFVADASGGDLNTLVSWGMEMSAVPEPASFGVASGLIALAFAIRRKLWSRLA